MPLPLLFVCEDNGLGISVRSPAGWVESALRARPQLRYERACPATTPRAVLETAADLVDWIRAERAARDPPPRASSATSATPAPTSRRAYRTPQEIRDDWDRDPLLATGDWLAAAGARSGAELADDYLAARERVLAAADEAAGCRSSRPRTR